MTFQMKTNSWVLLSAVLFGVACAAKSTDDEDPITPPVAGQGGQRASGRGGAGMPGQGGDPSNEGAQGGSTSRDAGVGSDARTNAAADAGVAVVVDETAYLKRPVPIFWITLAGAAITKTPGATGDLKVIEKHDGTTLLKAIDGLPVALASKVNLQIRGSSSAYFFAQKPYGLELQDDKGMSIDLSPLGLPKESDWVLSSCYADKTCLRNAVTYVIGSEMGAGVKRWTPRLRWVEVYIDAKYEGLYLLVEKPKGNKGRVDLPHPAATAAAGDITGGYMFSADADKATFSFNPMDLTREFIDTRSDRRWKYRFPKKTDYTPEQKKYVAKDFDDLQVLLLAKGAWRDRIDVPSWIDYYLTSEFSYNQDAFYKSWYFHKRPGPDGGKWFMGPLWDFDIAFGNTFYQQKYCANVSLLNTPPLAFRTPLGDPTFQNEMKCRWHEVRKNGGPLDVNRIDALIDSFAGHIKTAKGRDATRWGNIGKFTWPNNYVGATWEDDVNYLKYWIHKHVPWMDANLKGLCPTIAAPPPVAALPQPPQTADDKRKEQTKTMPPQWNAMTDAPAFIPIEGMADPKWACPK